MFEINRKENDRMEITRRAFVSLLSMAAGAVVTLPSLVARAKKLAVPLKKATPLQEVGGSVALKIKGRTILFVRGSKDSVSAVDPTCTHKKCTVQYKPDDGRFQCPCHNSQYDLNGKVLGGPAPKDLTTYPAKLSGERIILTLPD